jgi:hypothetical protein
MCRRVTRIRINRMGGVTIATRRRMGAITGAGEAVRFTIADCGLRIADCGLRIADCGLRIADFNYG